MILNKGIMNKFLKSKYFSIGVGIILASGLILGAEMSVQGDACEGAACAGTAGYNCLESCPTSVVKIGGNVFSVTPSSLVNCDALAGTSAYQHYRNCDALLWQAKQTLSPNVLAYAVAMSCGNLHMAISTLVSDNYTGKKNKHKCKEDYFYCEVTGSCMAYSDPAQCNLGTNYRPFKLNPNIAANRIAPVKLNALVTKPPLGNKGYSCVIDWTRSFDSYDADTVCTFSSTKKSFDFTPADESAPTSTVFANLQNDVAYTLTCRESTGVGKPSSDTGVCRINVDYKEIN